MHRVTCVCLFYEYYERTRGVLMLVCCIRGEKDIYSHSTIAGEIDIAFRT